jgi:hypothetical protein
MIQVRFEGVEGLAKGLRASADSPRLRRKAGAVLTERATKIYDASQYLVPVSEFGSHGNPPGFLKSSGAVEPMKIQGNTVQVDIVYRAKYAWYVHEHLFARHKVGQAKYVEKPYLAERRGTIDALLEVLRDEVTQIAAAALFSKVVASS